MRNPFEYRCGRNRSTRLLALMRAARTGARLLAGGTDLLVRMKRALDLPAAVIDLKRVAELRADIARIEAMSSALARAP